MNTLNFEFNNETRKRIDQMGALTGKTSDSKVFAAALALYEIAAKCHAAGGKIIIRYPDRPDEEVEFSD